MVIEALIGQFPATGSVGDNLGAIRRILGLARPGELVVMPEGALSGYDEDPAFLTRVGAAEIEEGLGVLAADAVARGVHLFFGSCLLEGGRWYNAGLYRGPKGESFTYRKVNLATNERGVLAAGSELPVLEIAAGERPVKVAIQLCRELRYPEQWRHLAASGAEVFVYMTNAVGDASLLPVWRSHLVSRAAENQRFVLSANDSRPGGQKCPTAAVGPGGFVLWEAGPEGEQAGRVELDLSRVRDFYIGQARTDVVGWVYSPGPTSRPEDPVPSGW